MTKPSKPKLFHRDWNSPLPPETNPLFRRISFDIWARVFELCLADAFPKRAVLGDSLIQPLAAWMPPQSPVPDSCVPRNCCWTSRGARSMQARKCGYRGQFERRGLTALLHVDGYSRNHLTLHPGYQAHYLFLDPALWRFMFPETSPKLFAPQGLCLCALDRAIELLPTARHVELTFPSSTADYTRSPSSIFADTLRTYGAPNLDHLDLRFDWSCVFKAQDTRKLLLLSQSLRHMRGLNVTFLVHGPLLETLHIGAEEDFFTWKPSDLYSLLRSCPRLTDIELLTVMDPGSQHADASPEQTIELPRLVRLRVRDSLSRWETLHSLLVAPILARVEIDIISPGMGTVRERADMTHWWIDTIRIAEAVAKSCPPSLLHAKSLSMKLHYQRDMDERYEERYLTDHWPEFMQLSLARSTEVIQDPDSFPSEPYFVFTERSATASTKANAPAFRAMQVPHHPPGWIFYTFWACALNALDAMTAGPPHVTGRIRSLVVTSDDLRPSPNEWQTILFAIYGVRTLHVPGIREADNGLIHLILALGTRDGREIPGNYLTEIHLPDWNWSMGPIPFDTINEIMGPERQYLTHKATWY